MHLIKRVKFTNRNMFMVMFEFVIAIACNRIISIVFKNS